MRRATPASASPTTRSATDAPATGAAETLTTQQRFAVTIAHLSLAAEAAVRHARQARFQSAEQESRARQAGFVRRILTRVTTSLGLSR